jgi:glutamine amidotransferase
MKLPNVGWYKLETMKDNFNEIEDNSKFYFNHGYYCHPKDEEIILTKTNYGNFEFCSSIKKNNIMGSQFHPEKSSFSGMNFLKLFINQ